MRFIVVLLGLLLGGLVGYNLRGVDNPYELNYKRITLNLPITYAATMAYDNFPLGEKYLAEDMAIELRKKGFEVELYTLEDTYSNKNFRDGFKFYLRPYPELQLSNYHDYFDKDAVSVLFETIPYRLDEVKNADIVFTGSLKKNKEYRALGINSYFIPQFTRFDKFYRDPKPEFHTKVLFIGNRWPDTATRKSVDYAIKNDIDITVYGDGWGKILTGKYAKNYKAAQISSDYLNKHYSSADIVLNDTRDDMIEAGFISNRVFDVTACGGFLISDYIPEIEEIYGDSVPMYKNSQEFKGLIEYYLAHPEERKEKAERAQKITLESFGADTMLNEIVKVLDEHLKTRGKRNEK